MIRLATKSHPNSYLGDKNNGRQLVDYTGYKSSAQQIHELFVHSRKNGYVGLDDMEDSDNEDLSIPYYGSDGAGICQMKQELEAKRSVAQSSKSKSVTAPDKKESKEEEEPSEPSPDLAE